MTNLKRKLTPDDLVMILSDFSVDGEYTTCKDFKCSNCPLGMEVPVVQDGMDICDILGEICYKLNREVADND